MSPSLKLPGDLFVHRRAIAVLGRFVFRILLELLAELSLLFGGKVFRHGRVKRSHRLARLERIVVVITGGSIRRRPVHRRAPSERILKQSSHASSLLLLRRLRTLIAHVLFFVHQPRIGFHRFPFFFFAASRASSASSYFELCADSRTSWTSIVAIGIVGGLRKSDSEASSCSGIFPSSEPSSFSSRSVLCIDRKRARVLVFCDYSVKVH